MSNRTGIACIAAWVVVVACDGRSPLQVEDYDVPADPEAPIVNAPTLQVRSGTSIQAAVDSAQPGAAIHIEAGLYRERIVIAKPGIRLVGGVDEAGESVVIENPGAEAVGVVFRDGSAGGALLDVTIRGFDEAGLVIQGIDGFLISGVTAEDNTRYGIVARAAAAGVIEGSTARGHGAAGFRVEESEDLVLLRIEATGNALGVEILNSSRIDLAESAITGNAAGVVVARLPGGLASAASRDVRLTDNRVRLNNRADLADPRAALAAAGSGVLVLGARETLILRNDVTGHDAIGIGVASAGFGAGLAGPDRLPEQTRVEDNILSANGSDPLTPSLAGDLFWDGSGAGNCWLANDYLSSSPTWLPPCGPWQ